MLNPFVSLTLRCKINGVQMFMYAEAFNSDITTWDINSVTDVSQMFYGATNFNQQLCEWGFGYPQFPYSSAKDMFTDSGCEIQDSPGFGFATGIGPFCQSDCIPTASPTSMPSVSKLYNKIYLHV